MSNYYKLIGENKRFFSHLLGIIFIIHAAQLLLPPVSEGWGQDYIFVPLLSPLISLFAGIFLLILPRINTARFQVLILCFVIGRSLLGMGMGLFVYWYSRTFPGYEPIGTGTLVIGKTLLALWSWILFAAALYFSITQLRSISRNLKIPLLLIVITTIALFAILYFFLGQMLSGFT